MSGQVEQLTRVSVFGGMTGDFPARESLRAFLSEWKIKGWDGMDVSKIEDLDAMWLAADIGRLLAAHSWQLVTGGYDMGTMGMGSRSAAIFGRRYGTNIVPEGVPLPEYFPRDPHTTGRISGARNLPERLEKLTNVDGFIILRGDHGTLNELITVIEQEDLRDEATREASLEFNPRPIIIADPTGKMAGLLQYVFGEYVPKFCYREALNVIDRIFILDDECFVFNRRENPLAATLRLSSKGESHVVNILNMFAQRERMTIPPDEREISTLREFL